MLNPAQSLFTANFVRDYSPNDEEYRDEPETTHVKAARPKPNVEVAYVLYDRDGAELRRGTGTTDHFGTLRG